MAKKLLYLFIAVSFFGTILTACSEEEVKPSVPPKDEIQMPPGWEE